MADNSNSDDSRYRHLVNAITDYAIYMLDAKGHVVSWNPGAQRFKGYTADEIIGEHFSRFYTDEDREAGIPALALRKAEFEGRFEAEGWRVRNDGSRFWASVVIDPVRDESGELIGFAKITRDLTERRKVDEALKESERRFRLLVQSVVDYAIYMLDPDGRVTNWNTGAERIKGYRPDEIIGEHFSRFYTEEDRAIGLPQHGLQTAARTGRFEKEGWRVRKDGSRFFAHVIIDAIRGDDGELIGFAKVTRDITERMEAQRELEQAREAFFQAQKMEAIGQLTGGVAHDFNNLLAAIISSLDLARKRYGEGHDINRFLDNAVKAAERGAALTQRMLAFARRQDLRPENVNVPRLVRGMSDLLQRTLGSGVHVDTCFPTSVAAVSADPNQLELAVLNLCVNARDAMPGGGTIRIGASEMNVTKGEHDLKPGRYVCLSVRDEGEGMNPETLARATEPFFTTKGIGKGTGLGLSMVHGMAEQLGGTLRLRSRPGEGTTAEIWLPANAADDAPVRRGHGAARDQGSTRPLVVLAVDDDPLVLLNTATMLEDLGHEVIEAGNGAEALAILRQQPVDLVLTDFAMPGTSGLQLANAIKAEQPSLPVIIVSGYAEIPDDEKLNLPKLAKPFRQHELVAAINRATQDEAKAGV